MTDLAERLRAQAASTSRTSKMVAESKTERNKAAGDQWADYSGLEPEQTLEWQAADALEAQAREIARLESGLTGIVNFQSPLTRAQMREAAADILNGRTGIWPDQSPFVVRAEAAESQLSTARRDALEKCIAELDAYSDDYKGKADEARKLDGRPNSTARDNDIKADAFAEAADLVRSLQSPGEPAPDYSTSTDVLQCICGRPYNHGPDLVISDDAWARIAPRPDGGGVLCPNCIHDQLVAAGFGDYEAPGVFTSGPLAAADAVKSSPAKGVTEEAATNKILEEWGHIPPRVREIAADDSHAMQLQYDAALRDATSAARAILRLIQVGVV